MPLFRPLLLAICILAGTAFPADARQQTIDSLQQALSRTVAPAQRVQLLLDLKDLNEDSALNLPLSIQLFREAAAIEDIYAVGVAIVPIVNRYAPYPEMEDSLDYYIATLRRLTHGKRQEGMSEYVEMAVGFHRLRSGRALTRGPEMVRETIAWSDSLAARAETPCQRAKRLLLLGYASQLREECAPQAKPDPGQRIRLWEEAYSLTHDIRDVTVRKYFANIIFVGLSNAYNQTRNYEALKTLTSDYIALLDAFYAADKQTGRRRYLYTDNGYVRPYQQLMRGALNIGRKDWAEQHFNDLRRRLLNGREEDLDRNKTYIYELGYLWKGLTKDYNQSVRYTDSLIYLIRHDKGYFRQIPQKIYQVYHDRSLMLTQAGRYREALESFAHTARIQDSIFNKESFERSRTIRRLHEMDKLRLRETRSVIRNRLTTLFSFSALGILMLSTGAYLFHCWRRNRRMQQDILRHSRKAQESEHMKSIFVNTICQGIGPPLDEIDCMTRALMVAGANDSAKTEFLISIRESTEQLLSTLDNMLEAANLDSLTGHLQTEPTDVDEVCRAELLTASRVHRDSGVEFRVEAPDVPCIVPTHRKYFTFVIRALLDNAGKATRAGHITLRYEADAKHNVLRVTVSDTGCGIPPEQREKIFRPIFDMGASSRGLSLPLCRIIARHLSGTISLDEQYGPGACFIFTIPLQP